MMLSLYKIVLKLIVITEDNEMLLLLYYYYRHIEQAFSHCGTHCHPAHIACLPHITYLLTFCHQTIHVNLCATLGIVIVDYLPKSKPLLRFTLPSHTLLLSGDQ